jgi:predicted O-linked N-acetylglucosamine transferase (SPINDLY family)
MFSKYKRITTYLKNKAPLAFDFSLNYKLKIQKLIRERKYNLALDTISESSELNTDFEFIDSELLLYELFTCDWRYFEQITLALKNNILKNNIYIPAVTTLYLFDSASIHQIVAQYWCNKLYSKSFGYFPKHKNEKIRIGYFSPDFKDHALMTLMLGVFENHNLSIFDIYIFNLSSPIVDEVQKRLRNLCSNFFDIHELDDESIIALVKQNKIDIAVNLIGYFGNNSRPNIFSKRLAPVQVSYMYAGTMAMHNIDYILADEYSLPFSAQKFYNEKIIHLPTCLYTFKKSLKKINYKSREDLGIPNSVFVYVCLNASYKLNPELFRVWLRILDKTKNTVLVLRADNEEIMRNLREFTKNFNISQERLIFINTLDRQNYFSVLKVSDLFLDTYPYGAHTVAVEAAYYGLPLVTLKGESFASRISSSISSCLNSEELITSNFDDYESLAISLSGNSNLMSGIRRKINDASIANVLFNPRDFTKNLENIYKKIISDKFK